MWGWRDECLRPLFCVDGCAPEEEEVVAVTMALVHEDKEAVKSCKPMAPASMGACKAYAFMFEDRHILVG